jgi:predicted metal-dependent RNase
MEEYQEFFSRVALIKSSNFDFDFPSLIGKSVQLEIDTAYTIGKSVAVLHGGQIIGHLLRCAAKPVWMHLKSGHRAEATIYKKLDSGFENSVCFSMLTKSQELGIRIRVFFVDSLDGSRHTSGNYDAKVFLSYIKKHRLNCFPGVTRRNCPPTVKDLLM